MATVEDYKRWRKEGAALEREGDKFSAKAMAASKRLWAAQPGSPEAKAALAEQREYEKLAAEARRKARMLFGKADDFRAAQKKKPNPRKRNTTIIKAKRATIVQVKKANPRKRNVTSASDLVLVGEAKAATRDGVKGWMVARKFFPRSATPKTARLTSGAMLDLKYGDVWKLRKKGNPKYLVTGTKTTRKVEDLGILEDKSATAAIARARRLYKGHTNVKARRKNISQGFYDGNGIFHPIRAAEDYDGATAGETGGKAKRTRSKKRKAAAAKASRTARERAAKRSASKTKRHLASRSLSRSYSLPAGSKRKKNIAQGFYDGNGIFHPIRASHDYDGKTAGETGGKPRRTRSKKRAAMARKASQTARQRAATKQRKATTTRLASRSLQRSYPLKKAKRRNPNAAAKAGYESFQGKPSKRDTSLNFPNGTPANLYKLGTLHSIKLQNGSTIKPTDKTVWLCADTKGKLHLGTTGERLVNAPKGSLGKVAEVEYITSKPHLGEPGISRYFHKLGEETGEKPTLYSDGNGGLIFKGGAYSITSRGIVN